MTSKENIPYCAAMTFVHDMRTTESPPQSCRGFSLLELIMVMALIGLITAVVSPNFSGSLATIQTRSAVKKVSAILRHARNQAVVSGRTQQVLFDQSGNRVILMDDDDDQSMDSTARIYSLPAKTVIAQTEDMQEGAVDKNHFAIFFYPTGNSSGGRITISGKSGHSYPITVDFITGTVEVAQ